MKYVTYQPFITKPDYKSTACIPENMFRAQQLGFQKLSSVFQHHNMNGWLASELGYSVDEMFDVLIPEQLDSLLMAMYNIQKSKECIVGDETGIGKGRVLASIARYALLHSRKVIFFTENTALFSDFWRDLKDTKTDNLLEHQDSVFLLHGDGKVFDGEEVRFKSYSKRIIDNFINTGSFEYESRGKQYEINPDVVLTTYSQFSRMASGKTKLKLLQTFIASSKETPVVIFDEFHNSTGNSTTKEFKDAIVSLNIHPIYSSATFLDNPEQIRSFISLLNLKRNEKIMQSLDFIHSSELDNQIAFYLSKEMRLLRREHKPVEKMNYKYLSGENEEYLISLIEPYRNIVTSVFDLYLDIETEIKHNNDIVANVVRERMAKINHNASDNEVKKQVKRAKEEWKNKWEKFGSTLNRLNRTLLLLGKIPATIDEVVHHVKENRKCVITLDSTLEAMIDLLITENEYHDIKMSLLLKRLVKDVVDEYVNHSSNAIKNKYEKLMSLIDEYPDLDVDFIDKIKSKLKQQNIETLEISGRTNRLTETPNGYKYETLPVEDKHFVIGKFNNEEQYQCIIITRAGSTGISLHASDKFKDQRQRVLIEPQITSRVKTRKQFWGRIARRGEVVEGLFVSLVSNIPFEKRIVALEEMKLAKMRAYVGSDYETDSLEFDYYNDFINKIVYDYLSKNINIAKKLGISLYRQDYMYFIDSLLKRSIFLTNEEQNDVFDFIDSGFSVYKKTSDSYDKVAKTFTSHLSIQSLKPLYGMMEASDVNDYKNLSIKDKIDTDLPIVQQCLVKTKAKIIEQVVQEYLFDVKSNMQILHESKKQFSVTKYRQALSHVRIGYEMNKNVREILWNNLQKMKSLTIGSQIHFNLNGNRYFGYVENIDIPDNYQQFTSHYGYQVKLVNPQIMPSNNRIITDRIYIFGSILLENSMFGVVDKPIDFDKYVHVDEVEQESVLLVGNMFFLAFFNYLYNCGEYVSFNYDGKQVFALRLPNKFDMSVFEEAPIIEFYKMFSALSKNGYIVSHDKSIRVIKKEKVNQSDKEEYAVLMASYVYNDERIVDFKMKEYLGRYKTDNGMLVFDISEYGLLKTIIGKLYGSSKLVFLSKR